MAKKKAKQTVKSTITYGGKKFVCVGKRVKNKPRVFCALATKAKAEKKAPRKRRHKVSAAEVARMRHRESYEAYMEGGLAGRRRRRRRRVLRRRAR